MLMTLKWLSWGGGNMVLLNMQDMKVFAFIFICNKKSREEVLTVN
jgi:hypothetical protein